MIKLALGGWLTGTLAPLALAALARAQGEVYLLTGEVPNTGMGAEVAGVGDIDNDGVPDIAAVATTYLRVWSGRTGEVLLEIFGTSLTPPLTAKYSGIGPAGDVNGDGVPDFWAASVGHNVPSTLGAGAVWIHSGVHGEVLYSFEGDQNSKGLGGNVAGGADLNGDGFADFAISLLEPQRNPSGQGQTLVSRIDVHSGFDGRILYQVKSDELGETGGFLAMLNDLDGDGICDFVTAGKAAPAPASLGHGVLRWFSGADGSMLLLAYQPTTPASIACAGDLDGDGLFDVVYGAPGETRGVGCPGQVHVYSSADASKLMTFQNPSGPPCEQVGWSVDDVGDFDGDGVPDVIAGTTPPIDTFFVVSGKDGSILMQKTYDWDTWFGANVAGVGDLNGDGLGDIATGHLAVPFPNIGSVHVYLAGCPEPQSYCTAKTNSQGCQSKVSWNGLLSLSIADNFVVRATKVTSSQLGMLLWSREDNALPFLGGTLCLGTPLMRLAPQSSGGSAPSVDCTGVLEYALTHQVAGDQGWIAGDTIHAQLWYRDPTHPDHTRTGLSDALRFSVCH